MQVSMKPNNEEKLLCCVSSLFAYPRLFPVATKATHNAAAGFVMQHSFTTRTVPGNIESPR